MESSKVRNGVAQRPVVVWTPALEVRKTETGMSRKRRMMYEVWKLGLDEKNNAQTRKTNGKGSNWEWMRQKGLLLETWAEK